MEGWLAPAASLDAAEKIKITCPCQELIPRLIAILTELYWLSQYSL
jgi:hypothetical protein